MVRNFVYVFSPNNLSTIDLLKFASWKPTLFPGSIQLSTPKLFLKAGVIYRPSGLISIKLLWEMATGSKLFHFQHPRACVPFPPPHYYHIPQSNLPLQSPILQSPQSNLQALKICNTEGAVFHMCRTLRKQAGARNHITWTGEDRVTFHLFHPKGPALFGCKRVAIDLDSWSGFGDCSFIPRGKTLQFSRGATDWFKIGKGVHQGCLLSACVFNLYAECILKNARLDEAQAGDCQKKYK